MNTNRLVLRTALAVALLFLSRPLLACNDAPLASCLSAVQADKLHAAGLTGKGIKVGVISGGVTDLASAQQAGYLPATIGIVGNNPGTATEGTEMLQVVHELAPEAELYYCDVSQDGVAPCAADLISQYHVNIVVDDILDNPLMTFEPTAAAVYYNNLLAAYPDVLALHSASNAAATTYQAPFSTSPIALTLGGVAVQAQDFGASVGQPSTPYETVSIAPAYSIELCAYWNDDPNTPPPSSNDELGLWILDASGSTVLASTSSTGTSMCLHYTNPDTEHTGTVQVVLGVIARNNTQPLHLALQRPDPANSPPVSFSIVTPGGAGDFLAMSPNLIAVAAADANPTDGYPDNLDYYSETGPYWLDWSSTQTGTTASGWPILTYTHLPALEALHKPDLTGESYWPVYGGTEYFGGTSSAAPSVAGIAALLMQAGLTRDQIVTALEQTGKPLTFDPYGGKITQSQGTWNQMDGYGLIQGYDALKYAGVALPQPAITASATTVEVGGSVTLSGDCTITGGESITGYTWTFTGNGSSGALSLPGLSVQNPGAVTFPDVGTWTATFNCTDSAGLSSGDPASQTISVTAPPPPSGGTGSGGGSSGGGGALGAGALALLLGVLALSGRRRRAAP